MAILNILLVQYGDGLLDIEVMSKDGPLSERVTLIFGQRLVFAGYIFKIFPHIHCIHMIYISGARCNPCKTNKAG